VEEQPLAPAALEPGSFRDPNSRVLVVDGRVLRALSPQGLEDWRRLRASPLFAALTAEEKLVGTHELEEQLPEDALHGEVAGALEHDVVPFVSYPYEWPFEMLRDAALLQLELVRRAIDAGLMLKDATPYNIQFRGARPVFVDVGSFERLREGEPWVAYRQFCMLFLYPLLLHAWKGIPQQPWLRGSLDGITPQECRDLLSTRDLFRRGALTHVALHARLERRHADRGGEVKTELKQAGFKKELIVANVQGLERLISRLRPPAAGSTWSSYELTSTYTEADAERKRAFVAAAVAAAQPRLVWDVGCNEGHHARLAATTADTVVAMDADAVVVGRLYEELAREQVTNVLPLVVDVTDPSPGLGWRLSERRPLADRGRPDLTFALALVHHVSIPGNVPIAELVRWLHGLGGETVVEFPTPEDPMVQRLLSRKRPGDHPDYNREWFERCLRERFDVVASDELAGGQRVLYRARARA
jgi:SAM-dependent methyltransferase